jgi:hypothetical protein
MAAVAMQTDHSFTAVSVLYRIHLEARGPAVVTPAET